MIIVLFLTLYISRILLDVLGVEDYGIYNVVGGFVTLFAFLNTSMSNGVQRYFNVDIGGNSGSNISEIYTASLYIQVALAVIIFLFAEGIGLWYINNIMVIPDERLSAANWVFQFSLISFMIVIMQVPFTAAVMAYERMNYFALVSIIDVVIRFVVVYVLNYVHNYDNLIIYAGSFIVVSFVDFLLYYIYTKKHFSNLKIIQITDRTLFKRMVSFSGWNIFGSFAYMIKDQGLNMLLNVYFGPIVNAARAISYQVSSALSGFSGNIFAAFRPQLMQSYSSKDYHRTTSLMCSMSKFTYYLMVLIAFPVIIEIDYILHIWLGDNVPENTSIFTVIIILNMLVTNFNPPVSQIVHATGMMKKYQVITSIVLTSILPISWIALSMNASAEMVFWISLIVAVVNQFICLMVLKSLYTYSLRNYITSVIMPCFYVSALVFPIPYVIHNLFALSFMRLVLVCIANAFVSVIAIFYLGLTLNERHLLMVFIKNKIKH